MANPSDEIYLNVRRSVITAQRRVYAAVNSAMVEAYWEIGEQIYCACGENLRAEYGKNLLKFLSEKLTEEFGNNFSERNLRYMRQFYLTFPIRNALRSELRVFVDGFKGVGGFNNSRDQVWLSLRIRIVTVRFPFLFGNFGERFLLLR